MRNTKSDPPMWNDLIKPESVRDGVLDSSGRTHATFDPRVARGLAAHEVDISLLRDHAPVQSLGLSL